MHSLFILILLGFFVAVIHSRPPQSEENKESQEDLQYENDNGSPAGDTTDDSHFGDEDASGQELEQNRRLLDMNRNIYLQKNAADPGARANFDIPEYKTIRNRDVRNDKNKDGINPNDEFQNYGKHRQFSKYTQSSDANDQSEMVQHLTNRDVNNYKNNHVHNYKLMDKPLKRTIDSKKAEEGDLLFENNHEQISKVDKKDYKNNEPLDLSQRSSYTKQCYNQMQSDNKATIDTDSRYNEYLYSRDRREVKKENPVSNVDTGKEDLEKPDNESEEMAIRRHIKKMSSDELEQLLNSLSEEKRALLSKIIDDVELSEKSPESIQKREITKKAGAVEDNSDIESSQSESSKIQDGLSGVDVTTAFPSTQNLKMTQVTKQPDNQPDSTELTIQKVSHDTNTENKADLNSNNDNNPMKSDIFLSSFASIGNSNKNQPDVVANDPVTAKKENKRETAFEDVVDVLSIEDPKMLESEHDDVRYYRSQDEDMSQFLDDVDQSGFYDSSKNYKRDVEKQSELDSKFKSLEESFPNSDAYGESAPYTGPLIRVKRKNPELNKKKRSLAILPDDNVGFFPYKAESEDDDNDEGTEFDDDGFYGPAPNFASNENKNVEGNSQQTKRNDEDCKPDNVDNASAGTMSLGSDTDNVLSGVEGVDENLMFSSAIRNRRKTDGSFDDHVDENNINLPAQEKKSDEETKGTSNTDVNIPRYQENESFGGYPRNYEGELSRYKRIRRVKQSRISEDPSNI